MSKPEAASLDTLWNALVPHIEWPEGFALSLLFAGHPKPVREIRRRVELSVQERGRSVRAFEPMYPGEIDVLASELVRPVSRDTYGVQWVSLIRGAGSSRWTEAVRRVLQRLNERRFLLERDAPMPLVLVLPLELRSQAYVDASDLWTVRSFVGVVPPPGSTVATLERGLEQSRSAATQEPEGADNGPSLAEREWARLLSSKAAQGLDPADGLAAFESAASRTGLRTARRIAMQTLAAALSAGGVEVEQRDSFDVAAALSKADPPGLEGRRKLSIAIENLGRVELDGGNLVPARVLFQRSLDIREGLAEAEPDNAQALRNLSIACNYLGELKFREGSLTAARALFQRSLKTCERWAKTDPRSVEALRGLSTTYNYLGMLEVNAGDLAAARTFFQHSLDIREGLAEADPHSARPLRDLFIACDSLGKLEVDAGNLAAARTLFQRSLDTRERLAAAAPHSAQALRDISIACTSLGTLEVNADNLTSARTLFQRSVEICERLAKASPHSVLALRDLSIACTSLGNIEIDAGNLASARTLCRRAVETCEQVAKIIPSSAQALRDLAVACNHLGTFEVNAGNLSTARTLFQRSVDLAAKLAESDPHNAQASFDLVGSLLSLAAAQSDKDVARRQRDRARSVMLEMDAAGHVKGYAHRERTLRELLQHPPKA